MKSSSQTQRRSKLFVDVRLQGAIVKRILLHWLILVAVGTVIAVSLRLMMHPTVPFRDQLGEMIASFGPYVVTMFALLPVFVVDTIKLTNRFAGPFVRFRRHIRALVENEHPGPVKFRDGDYWRETEGDLNALLSEIEELRQEVAQHSTRSEGQNGHNCSPTDGPSPSKPTSNEPNERGEV